MHASSRGREETEVTTMRPSRHLKMLQLVVRRENDSVMDAGLPPAFISFDNQYILIFK